MTHQPTIHEFFGWHQHPFTDTRVLGQPFLPEQDQHIIARALSLISLGKSFAITGPSGTGKSTLIHHLLSQLDPHHYRPVLLHYGGLKPPGVLRAIADLLGVDSTGRQIPLLVKLQKHIQLMSQQPNHHFPVFIVDDAHLLERQSLLDLCSLLVLANKNTVAASLILTGDPAFRKSLSLHVMTPIRTRMTISFSLRPLDEGECRKFISSRLQQAEAPADLFVSDSIALIANHCHGNRREIMNMATVLLQEAFLRGEKTIGPQLVLESDLFDFSD